MSNERDRIIREMCLSYRSDYDLNKSPNDPPWILGLTDFDRKGLWLTMSHIYDTQVAPRIKNETNTNRKRKKGYKRKMD